MSLFRCEKCNCIENTAMSGYWHKKDKPALCSKCDPEIGRWHGYFPKRQYNPAEDEILNPPK